MNKPVRIREMILEDIEEIQRMGLEQKEFEIIEEGDRFWNKGVLEDWIVSDDDVAIVAENDIELVGFVLAAYHSTTRKATFENAYIKPQYRKSSTALRMYLEIETRLIQSGADFICGFVENDNEASKMFLRRCGFEMGKQYHWMNKSLK
ncbi:MAG: GNAT family N-acetyltransferase [Nanoarchaeota archaeon]|nr:GNAT family N-acetyltransferase [Nanoarchaeota archaeon]